MYSPHADHLSCDYIVPDGKRCERAGGFRLTVEVAGYDSARTFCEEHLDAVRFSRRIAGRNVRVEPTLLHLTKRAG